MSKVFNMIFSIIRMSSNMVAKFSCRGISDVATIRLYRILLRQIQALPSHSFLLQTPINPRDYGRSRLLHSLKPGIICDDQTDEIKKKSLCKLFARWLLRNEMGIDDEDTGSVLVWYKDNTGQDFHEDEDHDDFDMCSWTSQAMLLSFFRSSFRAKISGLPTMEKHRFAITAVKSLQDVAGLIDQSSTSTKFGMRVVATSR